LIVQMAKYHPFPWGRIVKQVTMALSVTLAGRQGGHFLSKKGFQEYAKNSY